MGRLKYRNIKSNAIEWLAHDLYLPLWQSKYHLICDPLVKLMINTSIISYQQNYLQM